jgi:hypothetical protein
MIGGLWYGPLFGRAWAGAMGMDCDKKPDKKVMQRALALQAFGLFLTTYVLAHSIQAWRASAWGIQGGDGPAWTYGFFGAFFTWIGFYIPLQLGKISWEGKPWRLFFINSGHDFVTLQVIGLILACWR